VDCPLTRPFTTLQRQEHRVGLVLQLGVIPKFVGDTLHVAGDKVRGGQQELQRGVGYGATALLELGSDEVLPVRNAERRNDKPACRSGSTPPLPQLSRPLNVPITDHASR
jgi:hypothetical protein